MLICVGSTNPIKLGAVSDALREIDSQWRIKSVDVSSGVSAQPWCDETFAGARNRAMEALLDGECDIGIGIEGGVCWNRGKIVAYAVIYAMSRDKENFSISPTFTLSNELSKLVLEGKELGEATDLVYRRSNTKRAEGAVGMLTRLIDRKRLYKDSVILALYPFYNGDV
ncbi:MAG: inosine/xanthosine triphosphatase [Metallosphaera sp.]|uniref:inosine/xanthosine triphosphatase n=1 Tax=Metallosphaera sp. TaxID=2020860 RepID=UPI0031677798